MLVQVVSRPVPGGERRAVPSRVPRGFVPATLFALGVLAGAAAPGQDTDCVGCHANAAKLREALGDPGRAVDRLLVDPGRLSRSVHASKSCEECHLDFGPHPHAEGRTTAGCADCHEKAAEVHAGSIHGRTVEGKAGLPVACSACHGVHDVMKPSDRESTLHPLNVHVTCTACHANGRPDAPKGDPVRFRKYASDIHAHGLIVAGLTVSATCVACHGGHDVKGRGDPASPVARQRVDATCGRCHVVPLEEYRTSVHHLRSNGTDHEGATCTDCHRSHGIMPSQPSFLADSVEACSRCHDERGTSFQLTYHGKVTSLGYDGRVATCSTCHENHAILPASDPASSIHPGRIVATCGRCHDDAHEGFAEYLVHADPKDPERNPGLHGVWLAMLGLIVTVIPIGGLHVVLWLVRSAAAREWRLKHHVHAEPVRWIRRMRPFYVGTNAVATAAILLLSGTGLPLYFSAEPWARALMGFFGGAPAAAFVHRFAAVLLMGTFGVFVVHILWRWLVRREPGLFRGPWSMVPRAKDLRDLAGNFRWFLGRGPKPPAGRYIYWEKFDFWAVFWGMAIMGFTGLMLWFPESFTRVVPAWLVNAAGVIHGMEALLAVAFHFAVQACQVHLRPDKFPLDTGFWTGIVPERELEEERPEEYELLRREGRLESLVRPPASRGARLAAAVFGGSTVVLGLLLLAMAVAALV